MPKYITMFDWCDNSAQELPTSEPIFRMKYDDNGAPIFYQDGERDVVAEIQEAAKGCSLQDLILRYERGEVNALFQKEGFFGDFSSAPCSYGEALNFVQSTKDKFYSLPEEIKEKFNNNIGEFADAINGLSEEDFVKKYLTKESIVDEVVKEVKDE